MIIDLDDKLNASIHASSLQQRINEVKQSDFQRKLFLVICFGQIIHIFDSCIVMFILNDPLMLLIYLISYSLGQLCALYKQFRKYQLYCTIIQLLCLILLFNGILYIYIIKAFMNGYLNQVLQMIKFQLIKIQLNVGYMITIVFCLITIFCDRIQISTLKSICVVQLFILIIFFKQSTKLPPLIEQCMENEFDIYYKYIQKCVEDNNILNYEEYKNSNEQISIIQTFQIKIHIPTLKKLLFKLSRINEQIYKYFICQILQGFLFYSNLAYLKYFDIQNSNIDIMLLSILGASSKPFHQFMISLYTQKQIFQFSCKRYMLFLRVNMYNQLIIKIELFNQIIKYYIIASQFNIKCVSLQCQNRNNIGKLSVKQKDYRTLILGISQICRHLGGIFMAYSVYDFLHEQLWEFLFIQLLVAQIIQCYFGFQTNIQF